MFRFSRRSILVALAMGLGCVFIGKDVPAEDDKALKLRVMTYNVLCSFCDKKNYDPWADRLEYHRDIYSRHKLDLIAMQEISKAEEVAEIAALNPEFKFIYYQETEGEKPKSYPDAAIAYRADRFEELERGFYWFSETPDTPFSRGWAKAAFWRLCAWVRLRDRESGREFYFSSSHYDNNRPNQEMSAPVTLAKTAPFAEKIPVIVAGDYNSKPDSPAYATLADGVNGAGFSLKNTYDLAEKHDVVSNEETKPDYDPAHRIDHIWVGGKGDFKVTWWAADLSVYGPQNRRPSDHVPLVAEIQIK